MPYQNMESRHLPGGTGRVLGRGRLCGGIALFGYDVGGSLPAEEKTNVFSLLRALCQINLGCTRTGSAIGCWSCVRAGRICRHPRTRWTLLSACWIRKTLRLLSIPARRVRRNRSGVCRSERLRCCIWHAWVLGGYCIGIQG